MNILTKLCHMVNTSLYNSILYNVLMKIPSSLHASLPQKALGVACLVIVLMAFMPPAGADSSVVGPVPSASSGYTVGTRSVQTATTIDNEAAPVVGMLEEGASLVPSGLSFGDRFRLLFVSSTKRNATSADIADYNSFVQTRAAGGHSEIAGFASGFRAVASTAVVDARDNSNTNPGVDQAGVPIYWLGGAKVADDYADFYDGDWDSLAAVDESGNTVNVDNSDDILKTNGIWTGSYDNGTGRPGRQLGSDYPRIADLSSRDSTSTPFSLLIGGDRPNTNARYLYALSPLIEYVGPELSVTGGTEVTEGKYPMFTISGTPTTSETIVVSFTVTQTGDFVCASDLKDKPVVALGDKTVEFTGSSVTVRTCTKGDSTPEPDGSVTVTINTGSSYRVSDTQGSATVQVKDNDNYVEPVTVTPELSVTAGAAVTEGSAASFTINSSEAPTDPLTVNYTVTASGDHVTSANLGAKQVTLTGSSATVTVPTTGDSTDEPNGSVTVTINAGAGYTVSGTAQSGTVTVSDDDDPPPVTPEVDITASRGGSEGEDVTFTLTATPAPTSELAVLVTVTASGEFGAGTGSQTITIPTAGSATLTIATTDDDADEPDGTITLSLNDSGGYTVGSLSTETVSVLDNDDAPVSVTPEVSVVAGSGITEGSAASFTINSSEAPTDPLTVNYTVTASGDHVTSANLGAKQVTLTGSSATVTVPTTGDSTDEPNGSVTITIKTGSGYTIGTADAGTVTVNDDDNPPPPVLVPPPPLTPFIPPPTQIVNDNDYPPPTPISDPDPEPEADPEPNPHPMGPVMVQADASIAVVTGYLDVAAGAYYAEPVSWAISQGVINVSGSYFVPDKPVTRGDAAMYLWNMAGQPDAPQHPFNDVPAALNAAVSWMANTGITTGTSTTTYSPDSVLTRAQLVTFLWRLAGQPTAPEHPFEDVHEPWQQQAVSWAAFTGITTGTSDTTFHPDSVLTRAHTVTFLRRYDHQNH